MLHLDAASRSIKTLRHFVCLLSEASWWTCEARHREGLPALSVHWPHSKRKGFNFRNSLQILDTLLTTENQDQIVIVTEEKCDGDRSKGTAADPSFQFIGLNEHTQKSQCNTSL